MSTNHPSIVVVGSCMIDQIARAPRLPSPGETLTGSSYSVGFGGKGANQAVMAARLGGAVTMIARLGNDDLGRATRENFRREKIDIEHVSTDAALPSGVAPIWIEESTGQNRIIIIPGANTALSPQAVGAAQAIIRRSQVVIAQLETPTACTLEAFTHARQGGAITLLNPAPAAPLGEELLRLTDYLVPNESELAALTGQPITDARTATAAARELLQRGTKRVLVTLGAQGALLVDADGAVHVPAPTVQAIDTSGAGDCFIGAFAYYIARGLDAPEAMSRANQIAALSVQACGTQSSYPRAEQLPPNLLT